MSKTIVRDHDGYIKNADSVLKTCQAMRGTFSAANVADAINCQAPINLITQEQVVQSISYLIRYRNVALTAIGYGWYRW